MRRNIRMTFREFKMSFRVTYIYFLLISVYANYENALIIDYFYYKQAPTVVGFSCNDDEDNLMLQRNFSKKGIVTSLGKVNNSLGLHLLAKTTYWKLGVFVDTRCYDAESIASIFSEANEYRMFGELYYWLILSSDFDEVLQLINDRTFGISTDFVIAILSDIEDYELYDAYNVFRDRGRTLNVTALGNWNWQSGLSISLKQMKFRRRSNLHRLTLKASFFKCAYKSKNDVLEDYLDDSAQASTRDGRSKFGFHILKHLSEMYNFTLELNESSVWQPGDPVGPVARALMDNLVDFSGSPLSMNRQRTYFLTYVHQDWPFRTCFIFRNPQPTNIKVQEIFRPFITEIWYLMALIIMISVMILGMLLRYEGCDNDLMRYSNSFLINIGAVCQQGTDIKMTRISIRIAFLFIMIFSLLVYNYYSASVVSARLDEPIFKINDSLNEFAKMHLKMSSEWMVYLEFFLKNPDWETQTFNKNYWAKLPEDDKFMQPEVGMHLVRKGGFAYHTHPDVGYPFIEKMYDNREICELMEVHLARPSYTAFSVRLNSTFIELTRIGLTKIAEVGLRQRQIIRWQFTKPRCRKDILSASSVTIYEFAPHLILLLIGMLMAIGIYIIEIVVVNRNFYLNFKMTARVTHDIEKAKNFCMRRKVEC